MQIISRNLYLLLIIFALNGVVIAQTSFHSQGLLIGKVLDENGKDLPGVAVTDGTSITSTDAKRAYQFHTTSEPSFVYTTLPSGYEIPHEKGVAKFYLPIKAVKGRFTADFRLCKMNRSNRKHFIILWADPQINSDAQAQKLISVSAPDTKNHLQELLSEGPVYGIAAGDINWDNYAMIPPYRKRVEATGIPFFQVLDNLDMDINMRSDEASDNTFHQNFGPSWYSFNHGNVQYVVLDNVFYYTSGCNYVGYITEQQLSWLEQDLSRVRPGSPVVVSKHISCYTHEKRRVKNAQYNPCNVTFNRQALYNLLKPFNAHLLKGYSHYNENVQEGGVCEHITAAPCGAWWAETICSDGTPTGYGVYEVDGNNVRWYYKAVGFPKSYQMRVYNRGRYPGKPSDIAVNIWNWDKDWKVEWMENGKVVGP